jgi:2-polyprenyl-6-methoxyphenol hydroxylase-like FAD-dependent oxidoreductase
VPVSAPRKDNTVETSVLIVGGGPVGLALGCELGMRGIDCTIVEKRDGKLHVPKMSLVTAGGMEMCRRWGIAEAVRTAVWSEHHALDFVYMETLAGEELFRLKVPAYAEKRPEWTPEGMCQCPQIYFDPILAARVARLDKVRTLYDTSLDSFVAADAGVTATISGIDGSPKGHIEAAYLVGCDGAHSLVREALGIRLEGAGGIANSVNIFFRSPRLSQMHPKGWARIYRAIDAAGCWSELIPIDGNELWRLTVFDDPGCADDPHTALRRMAGFDVPCEIISTLLWERRDAVAQSYGRGRVWLAGDSVHQSSPTGGAGMHTGLEEAVNLAWKLEGVLKGWGGPRLLPSYESERKPIAQRNIDLSTQTFRALRAIPPTPRVREESAWRTTDVPRYSIPDHVRTCPALVASPIIVDDGSPALEPAPAVPSPSTRPGARAPHAWIGKERSTLDLYGDGFVLLRLGTRPPEAGPLVEAARARGVPLRVVDIPDEAVAALHERRFVLVRPDRHVAWRGDDLPGDCCALVETIRGA